MASLSELPQESGRKSNGTERDEKHNVVSLLQFILDNPDFPVGGGRDRLIAVLSGNTAPITTLKLDSEDRRDPDDVPGPLRISQQ